MAMTEMRSTIEIRAEWLALPAGLRIILITLAKPECSSIGSVPMSAHHPWVQGLGKAPP
jgi:hypothetical protein